MLKTFLIPVLRYKVIQPKTSALGPDYFVPIGEGLQRKPRSPTFQLLT